MTHERWRQIKQLVNSALEQDAEKRSASLDQSCNEACAGDVSLRRGAEALLSFHERVTRNLSAPPFHSRSNTELSPEQWERIEKIFQSVMEIEPARRAAYLAEACADDELARNEVESLLVYQVAAGSLIEGAIQDAAGLLTDAQSGFLEKSRFATGEILAGRYRIIGLLGKGGMGEVYRADDLKLGQPVALKFLTVALSKDKATVARFHGEVRVARQVTHPNVCRVHDIGEVTTKSGNWRFLSMEYVDGEDLSSFLRRIGRLPADKAVEIAKQLCAGLAAAHDAGVLHRDLKPANVMIDGRGKVRITDFGLAGLAEQIRGEDVMAGTPAYMAPEQFAGKEVTVKSDIYALGLVLYEIFTGKRVFEASSLDELRRLHESSSPANPSNWVKDLDPMVERVILRCLEKDSAKRLVSAKQVADALPGGDPLAAALALGDTPSPEMLAAAGEKTGMRPVYAALCLVAIFAGSFMYAKLAPRAFMIGRIPFESPPESLAVKSREISKQLGHAEKPFDSVYGLYEDFKYFQYLEKTTHWPDRWRLLEGGRGGTIRFWYRESPRPLASNGKTTFLQYTSAPPRDAPGMVGLQLDTQGRLLDFWAKPPDFDNAAAAMTDGASAVTAQPVVPDWKPLFTLAGFDQSRFRQVEPEWNPDFAYDAHAAWAGTTPDMPDVPLRVESAGNRGKIVSFKVIYPWTKPFAQDAVQDPMELAALVEIILFLGFFIGAGLLARHNLRNGKGDRRGALRLAGLLFCGQLLGLLFFARHSITFDEIGFLVAGISFALFIGLFAWMLYLALEPYIRRRWPQSLVSWSRAIDGKLNDPQVGRDILVGLLTGIFIRLILILNDLRQDNPRESGEVFDLLNLKSTIGAFLVGFSQMALWALGIIFTLAVLRAFLRRDWLAIALVVLIIATPAVASHGLTVGLLGVVLVTGLAIHVFFRFGLLTLYTAFMISVCLFTLRAPVNLSAWYSSSILLALGLILALALYAFRTALDGQKLFKEKLLEE